MCVAKVFQALEGIYMELWLKISIIYIIIMNIVGFASMGIDKHKAKKHVWRIPEKTLFLIAILGGSLGSLIGMQVFRHKTKHKQFVVGIPVILCLQVCLFGLLYYHIYNKETKKTGFAMGTVISSTVYGKDSDTVVEEIFGQLVKLDTRQLSWREEGSSVAQWNQRLKEETAISLSTEEKQWLQTSLELCKSSDGALDITIHPVIEAWGIEGDNPKVPTEEEIQQALDMTGYDRLYIDENGILYTEDSDLSIDLGSVGKGIAADRIRDYLDTQEVSGAIVSIGGTILVYGEKPGSQEWQVGIQNPRGVQGTVLGMLSMKQPGVVSTSGDYEKCFIENGIRYHHIFNPSTGYPADSGLCSVTIVCDEGIVSDGLSTACFILGYEKSLPLLEKYGAEGIFVTTDAQVYVTEGLRDAFELTSSDYTLKQ